MTISIRTEATRPTYKAYWAVLLGIIWAGFSSQAMAQKTGFDAKFKYKESITLDALNERPAEELSLWYSKPAKFWDCLLYTSPSPRDKRQSRMPSSA